MTLEYDGKRGTVDKREFYDEYKVGDEILANIEITTSKTGLFNHCEITSVTVKTKE